MKTSKITLGIALAAVLALTGCSTAPSAPTVQKVTPSVAAAPVTPKAESTGTFDFGSVKTYTNDVSISISQPAPYQPTEQAAGVIPGLQQVVFTIVLTNGSDEVITPSIIASASSGGAEAAEIIDFGSPSGDIGSVPATAVLPGQSVKWLQAYSMTDLSSITYQIQPTYDYKPAIFTNIK